MSTITRSMPAPKNVVHDFDDEGPSSVAEVTVKEPPAYLRRKGFIPRVRQDFGSGGAFPEVHVAQYPRDMGKKKVARGTTVPVVMGKDGTVDHTAILRQGQSASKIIHSSVSAIVPKDILSIEDDPTLKMPDQDEIDRVTAETHKAIAKKVQGKIAATQPKAAAAPQELETTIVRYKPLAQGSKDNSGAKERVIRIVDAVKDPLEMAKFKHVKVPRGPGSPPPPVLHSPPRKVTAEEQAAMKIPPCISSWKNPKGFTIALDKRLATDGRGLEETTISDKFSKFAGALKVAERQMRETIQMQADIQKLVAQKDKEKQEADMRMRAQRARDERAGFAAAQDDDDAQEDEDEGEDTGLDANARDELREERRKEREREGRMRRAGGNKQREAVRERERDISEKIALGMATTTKRDGDFDTRLYNKDQGMGSGFKGDDAYNVYSEPLFKRKDQQSIYRPSAQSGEFEDAEQLKKGLDKFVADKAFEGADGGSRSGTQSGPVQFERQDNDQDVFGIDKLLAQGAKRGHDGEASESKRQR